MDVKRMWVSFCLTEDLDIGLWLGSTVEMKYELAVNIGEMSKRRKNPDSLRETGFWI
jgi:hypothetical protein